MEKLGAVDKTPRNRKHIAIRGGKLRFVIFNLISSRYTETRATDLQFQTPLYTKTR